MAAKAFRAKTVTFKSTSLTGITDVSIDESGTSHELQTDASHGVDAIFVDGITASVDVTTSDIAGASAWIAGDTGSLVITFEQRAEGSGAGATTKTATMAQATLITKPSSAQSTGTGNARLSFRCSVPSAASSAVAWT